MMMVRGNGKRERRETLIVHTGEQFAGNECTFAYTAAPLKVPYKVQAYEHFKVSQQSEQKGEKEKVKEDAAQS